MNVEVEQNRILQFALSSIVLMNICLPNFAYANSDSPYTILKNTFSPTKVSELRADLKDCIVEAEFVGSVTVVPRVGGSEVSVFVQNNSRMKISGLVVRSDDPRAKELQLDGEGIMEFGAIHPGEHLTHTEFVPALEGLVEIEESFPLKAIDVIDQNGKEILTEIFETRWPFISSASDLEAAQNQLCEIET